MDDSNHGVVRLRSGIHDELQNIMCWCVVRQTTNVAEDGVATSGYGTEYARQICAECAQMQKFSFIDC